MQLCIKQSLLLCVLLVKYVAVLQVITCCSFTLLVRDETSSSVEVSGDVRDEEKAPAKFVSDGQKKV